MYISHQEDYAFRKYREVVKSSVKNKAKTLNNRLIQFLDSVYKNHSLTDKDRAEIKAELLKHII